MEEWMSVIHPSNNPSIHFDLSEELFRVHHRNETRRMKIAEGELILEPIAGNPSLLVFGGGHVSRQVCRIAAIAGFRVTVIDDREIYATRTRFPEAAEIIVSEFSDSLEKITIKPSTFIVIVTRGHREDEAILERVLATHAKYVGMIGSKKKVLATYEHLVERGISAESLKRVHAPMGLEIGAATPEEIGVSIVAELVAVRRGEHAPYEHKSSVMRDQFLRFGKSHSSSRT